METMLREGSLKGQTIVITGGGTGLGLSMTRHFLSLGANCIISSRKADVLEKVFLELQELHPGQILAIPCDVRKYEMVESMLEQAVQHFGSVTALVNNAAGNFISPTEHLSAKAFDVVVDIVLKGSYNCTLAFGKYWIPNQIKGRVLSIVTTYAWTGSGYVVPSACGKAGVLALTRSLAAEWGKYGIRLNAIAPGPFPTEGAFSRLFPGKVLEVADPLSRIPLGRFGDHKELADLASYLISEYSSFMTGEVVTIDGGEWLYGAGEFNTMSKLSDQMWLEVRDQVRKTNNPQ